MKLSCKKIVAKLKALVFYPFQFKHFGKSSLILRPLIIEGKRYIGIGDHVYIQDQTRLSCVPLTGARQPELVIGNGCVLGNFNHIYATEGVVIEDKVLTADRVYIADNQHSYENVDMAVIEQPIKQTAKVRIGEGSWLGENVCVCGASIGKHCVIGANAVVTKDIPDYSIAVGIPARVIKQYNKHTKIWEPIR